MKSPAIFCMLILLVHICSVRSASLMNFGNFLQKHNNDQSRFLQQSGPQQQPRANLNNNNSQPPPPPLVNTNEQNRNEEDGLDQYSSESYSEYRSEPDPYLYNASSEQDGLAESSNSSTNETDLSAEQINENLNTSTSSTEHSISNVSTTESNSNSSTSESSGVVLTEVPSTPVSSTTTTIITSAVSNATSGKEVVLATAETTTEEVQKSILQKSLDWVKDDYILSILVPVAAGVLFAVTVICTIALCRCCRRCCRRRRFRKKCLPDSVRNLSTSDRKRLLGDMSSDDEF